MNEKGFKEYLVTGNGEEGSGVLDGGYIMPEYIIRHILYGDPLPKEPEYPLIVRLRHRIHDILITLAEKIY